MAKWASALLLWSQLKAQFIAPPLFRLKADTRAGCKAGGQGWWQLGAAGGSFPLCCCCSCSGPDVGLLSLRCQDHRGLCESHLTLEGIFCISISRPSKVG